jgi:ABC-type sugar transport system substrate-binding protein
LINKKRYFALALALVLAVGLAGCGTGGTDNGGGEGEYTIGLVVSTLNNPFFVDLRCSWKCSCSSKRSRHSSGYP